MVLRARFAAAGLLALTLWAGCAAAPSFDLTVTRLSPNALPLELYSGFTTPVSLVVRDQAAWADLWDTIYAGRTPRPPLPVVDFSRHLVVARAMGSRPTGGFAVTITGLLRQSGEYVVQVRETAPGAGCAVTLGVTSPVDVALITRTDDPIRFAIATETRTC